MQLNWRLILQNLHTTVFYPLYENVYDKQPNTIKSFELRIQSHIENYNINLIQHLLLILNIEWW